LREAAAQMLHRARDEGFHAFTPADRPVISGGRGGLPFRHGGEAVALLDAAENVAAAVANGRVELSLSEAAGEGQLQTVDRLPAELDFNTGRVRLRNVEDHA